MKTFTSPALWGALCLMPIALTGCRAKTSMPGAGNGDLSTGVPIEAAKTKTPAPASTPQMTPKPTFQSTPTPQPLRASPISDFEVTARAVKPQIKAGESAALEITVKNISDHDAILQFSSGQSFDFSATKEGSAEPVWNWAMNKMFMQALRMQLLKAGEYRRFTGNWDNVPAGKYQIKGTITANKGIDAAPFTLEATP